LSNVNANVSSIIMLLFLFIWPAIPHLASESPVVKLLRSVRKSKFPELFTRRLSYTFNLSLEIGVYEVRRLLGTGANTPAVVTTGCMYFSSTVRKR